MLFGFNFPQRKNGSDHSDYDKQHHHHQHHHNLSERSNVTQLLHSPPRKGPIKNNLSSIDLDVNDAQIFEKSEENIPLLEQQFIQQKKRRRKHSSSGSAGGDYSSCNGSNHFENSRGCTKSKLCTLLFGCVDSESLYNVVLAICYLMVLIYSMTITIGPLILHCYFQDRRNEWCNESESMVFENNAADNGNQRRLLSGDTISFGTDSEYPNPDYDNDKCRYQRIPYLGYLTLEECDMSRRLLVAVLLGGAIGFERKSSDRPAGIRTMGLVSLGACFFTISSIMAFKTSTMGWDASRVAAALPSGVGFLGGALIWKGTIMVNETEKHQVHGLTTAASLWLSAAIGVGIGGALYLVTIYSTIMVIMVLRYGPKNHLHPDHDEDDENNDDDDDACHDKNTYSNFNHQDRNNESAQHITQHIPITNYNATERNNIPLQNVQHYEQKQELHPAESNGSLKSTFTMNTSTTATTTSRQIKKRKSKSNLATFHG